MDIKVPQIAEGITSRTVIGILVKMGEEVQKDQPLVELETEKAVTPLPSPVAGRVEKVYVKEGDQVGVGQSLLAVATGSEATTASAAEGEGPSAHTPAPVSPAPTPVTPLREKIAEKMAFAWRTIPI